LSYGLGKHAKKNLEVFRSQILSLQKDLRHSESSPIGFVKIDRMPSCQRRPVIEQKIPLENLNMLSCNNDKEGNPPKQLEYAVFI
jgi:hypothetical protein